MKFRRARRAISETAAVLAILILLVAAGGYFLYQMLNAPKASISISLGNGCSAVNFQVTNNDARILHGWGVDVKVTPIDPHISVSPNLAAVAILAPNGVSAGLVSVAFATGTPVGTYQIKADLVNGTQTIASSNTLECTLK